MGDPQSPPAIRNWGQLGLEDADASSSDVHNHPATNTIRLHHAQLNPSATFAQAGDFLSTEGEPDHDELCRLEQLWFLQAIRHEVDSVGPLNQTVDSLRIVLAADESIRTGKVVGLR